MHMARQIGLVVPEPRAHQVEDSGAHIAQDAPAAVPRRHPVSRLLLCTFGPATFQAARWASVNSLPHAGAKRPNAPRMCCRAEVCVLLGATHARWQLPNLLW